MDDLILLLAEALRETAKAIKNNQPIRLENLADFMEREYQEYNDYNEERTNRGKYPVTLGSYRERTHG